MGIYRKHNNYLHENQEDVGGNVVKTKHSIIEHRFIQGVNIFLNQELVLSSNVQY